MGIFSPIRSSYYIQKVEAIRNLRLKLNLRSIQRYIRIQIIKQRHLTLS